MLRSEHSDRLSAISESFSFYVLCQSGLRVANLRTLNLMKNQSGSQKEKVRTYIDF